MSRTFVLLLALAVAGGAGYWAWRKTHVEPILVSIHTVDRGRVDAIVANTRAGTVEAIRRAKLAPQTGGQVARLDVREGARVEAGQVLLALWNEDLAAQIALAESELTRATALAEQTELMADTAERESKRMQELQAREISSEERTERMVAEAKAKRAEAHAASATVQVAKNRITVAKAAFERTILKAPFAGVIAEVNAELGEYVTPSPPGIPTLPAIDLIDVTSLFVKAPIDEIDAAQIRPGMSVRIALDALRGKKLLGQVVRTAPYVLDREKEARTVDVEVSFADPKESVAVLPGASADVEIVITTRASVVRVPTEALLEGKRAFVVRADDTLEERALSLGAANWQMSEVVSGLAEGERIVLSVDRAGVAAGAKVVAEQKPAKARE